MEVVAIGTTGAGSGRATEQTAILAEVADPLVVVVAILAGDAESGVAIAVETHGLDAGYASGGHDAVVGGALLASGDTGLAVVAMGVLALDALAVDELVARLARQTLAGAAECLAAWLYTQVADPRLQLVVGTLLEVAR